MKKLNKIKKTNLNINEMAGKKVIKQSEDSLFLASNEEFEKLSPEEQEKYMKRFSEYKNPSRRGR